MRQPRALFMRRETLQAYKSQELILTLIVCAHIISVEVRDNHKLSCTA
jgi:hypothetical protein